jgi:hypothetical protein
MRRAPQCWTNKPKLLNTITLSHLELTILTNQHSTSEANSISGGGMKWYSESYGAALWTADFAFEAARAGVSGVNMHWGIGG